MGFLPHGTRPTCDDYGRPSVHRKATFPRSCNVSGCRLSGYGRSAGCPYNLRGKEIKIPIGQDSVQFLVGNPLSVRWAAVSGTFSSSKLNGAMPVRGGNGADGTTLYIARAEINGGTYPGRVQVDGNAQIPYNGVEKSATEYKVLVYV
ncbi:hypothetical protein C8Q74DRAFT_938118 [Fomes fomentarius]|nr:hypothetical protein C8Q74DRAFT_938118 [Fomes fomentarius]